MIRIFVAANEMEANLLQGYLKMNDIKALIHTSNDSYSSGIFGVHNGNVPYDILVSGANSEKAKALLAEWK